MSRPRLRRYAGGQALVEFALMLPIVMLLIFGAIDLGRAVYAYNTVANAARDGARVAAVNQIMTSPDCHENRPIEDPSDAHWSITRCAAASAISLAVTPSDVTVAFRTPVGTELSCDPSALHLGCIASVTVRYVYEPMTPIIASLVGRITLEATSQMPIERVFP